MLNYLLLVVSLALGTGKNLFSKWGERYFDSFSGLMSVNILTSIIAVAVFALGDICFSNLDWVFILLALVYGALTLGSQSFYIAAVSGGSVAICSLIYASGFVIPTVYSAIYSHETIPATKAAGITLMIVSVILVSLRSKNAVTPSKRVRKSSSIGLALVAMLCSGGVGVIQKVFGARYPSDTLGTFLLLAFAAMLVFSSINKVAAYLRQRQDSAPAFRYERGFLLPAFLLSVCVVFANRLNLLLAGVLPGIVFFPLINGGTIMLSAIGSGVFFRERISLRVWCGIAIGVIAIVLIAL